jgi:hypothetical protein
MLNRLKEYIDYKGISISAFEKSIGMSNASFGKSLKKGGTIGADKLEIILKIYPEISLNWLVTGEGEMLKKDLVNKSPPGECGRCQILEERLKEKEKYIEDLRAWLSDKDETIRLLKQKAASQDNSERRDIA